MINIRIRTAASAVALACAVVLTPGSLAVAAPAATAGAAPFRCLDPGGKALWSGPQCDGLIVRELGTKAVAIVLDGRRIDFADEAELRADDCATGPALTLPPGSFRSIPEGPDPLYAAVDRQVDVPRITPAPHWRKDCHPLFRSDGRDPSVIFEQGFAAKDTVNGQYDITSYVLQNQPSPFVSTTYDAALYKKWKKVPWDYFVDAPGGIVVNETIGDQHQYADQVEVAFPGGVDRHFIRRACPVDRATASLVESGCVDNPNYQPWLH
ncbi:ADP-ribosyltransferase [Kitasatospora sp. NPDC096204]|uniref:ADP-ribosyltransferase n=1 Tax=Kitasatospora sp. NPDC096204 TaxID=3364094 RepID=UPI0038307F14